jgi:uncharacterized protein (DUF924 family)
MNAVSSISCSPAETLRVESITAYVQPRPIGSRGTSISATSVAVESAAKLEPHHKAFLYMPYMHSESRRIHEIAVELFSENGLKSYLDFELWHKAIIDRFGRYPHRNKMLGRNSSEEESDFLKTPGSSF